MSDVFTVRKRSEVMSKIRSRGNKDTEIALAGLLRAERISGWRRHIRLSIGPDAAPRGGQRRPRRDFHVRPDFVFEAERVAVFVDGCFWHGCTAHGVQPRSNYAFWKRKLDANIVRDRLVTRKLRTSGWTVLRIWEHEFAAPARVLGRLLSRLERARAPRRVTTLTSRVSRKFTDVHL